MFLRETHAANLVSTNGAAPYRISIGRRPGITSLRMWHHYRRSSRRHKAATRQRARRQTARSFGSLLLRGGYRGIAWLAVATGAVRFNIYWRGFQSSLYRRVPAHF